MRVIIIAAMLSVKPNAQPKPPVERRHIPSGALLGRAGEAVIVHNGREYRLRQTQNGKLILTA